MDYGKHFSTRETPQYDPIPGSTQVANNAGGFVWELNDWDRLDRFLILGTEGGTYYVGEHQLTLDAAEGVLRCIESDGVRTVKRIVEISETGRAPKNDPAIFALAMSASLGKKETRALALILLPRVCRIGTHLFHFIQFVQEFRGWGRGLRRAVGAWYNRNLSDVAYQVIKYQQRDGWTHRDLLRLSHPKPSTENHKFLFEWITKGKTEGFSHALVNAVKELKVAENERQVAKLVRDFKLPREAVESASTEWLNHLPVWEALLEHMPLGAMVRNLARMTTLGLLAPLNNPTAHIVRELDNVERIHHSRLHPISLLSALKVYAQGHGERGNLTWTPVPSILDALDAAFYIAFDNFEPTRKNIMLALDVSGSMGIGRIAGIPGLTPRDVTAALAMVTAAREPNHVILGFTAQSEFNTRGLSVLPITPKQRLDDVVKYIAGLPYGSTDCAIPMLWARETKTRVDGMVMLTDNETWDGDIHPSQALQKYRREMGLDTKLVVVGMTASKFTIADPNDIGMLDVVGCDTATPNLISDFIR